MPVIPASPSAPTPPAPAPPPSLRSFFPIQKLTPKFLQNVAGTQSPITLSSQYQDWQAQLLAYSVGLVPMKRAKAAQVIAALIQGRTTPLMFGPTGAERFPQGDANTMPQNMFQFPEQLDNAAWFGNSSGAANPTVTANAGGNPFNSAITSELLAFPATTAGQWSGLKQVLPISGTLAGRTFTASIWLYNGSGSGTATISLIIEENTFLAATVTVNPPVGFTRYSVTITVAANSTTDSLNFHIRSIGPNAAQQIFATAAQFEEAASPTPYQTPGFVSVAGVAGANTIQTTWPLLSRTVLKAMDYIQLNSNLYVVLTDVVTDASGNATITLFNPLRAAVPLNTSVITQYPQGLFRVVGNTTQWTLEAAQIYGLGFDLVEEFPG